MVKQGVSLIQYNCCPYKNTVMWRARQTEEQVKVKAEKKPRNRNDGQKPPAPNARGGAWNTVSLTALERTNPADALISDF